MRYLVLCKHEDSILDWKEIRNEPSDNAAVMSAFAFGTFVDGADVIEVYCGDPDVQLLCHIVL